MVTTHLKIKAEDTEYSAASNIELIATRMSKLAPTLQSFCDSSVFIDNARDIIKDYESMAKYIDLIKTADERATDCHNRLYKRTDDP